MNKENVIQLIKFENYLKDNILNHIENINEINLI